MGMVSGKEKKLELFDESKLICYGCAHSDGMGEFPGRPSGERPCGFCIRNPETKNLKEKESVGLWYDGSPAVKYPMDCYHSIDMKEQFDSWQKNGN